MRIYFLEDQKEMLAFLNAVAGRNKTSTWDSDLFNNDVMPRIKDALQSLAER